MKPLTQREINKLNHVGKRAVYTGGILAVIEIKKLGFWGKLKFVFTE